RRSCQPKESTEGRTASTRLSLRESGSPCKSTPRYSQQRAVRDLRGPFFMCAQHGRARQDRNERNPVSADGNAHRDINAWNAIIITDCALDLTDIPVDNR